MHAHLQVQNNFADREIYSQIIFEESSQVIQPSDAKHRYIKGYIIDCVANSYVATNTDTLTMKPNNTLWNSIRGKSQPHTHY